MAEVVEVPIDEIRVPETRVTSYFEPAEHEALKESMKSFGQRVPIILYRINGELWLADGYHRLQTARELGWKTIKAIIYDGDRVSLDVDNLITAAIRGRNNPAQFAKVVKRLHDEFGLSWKEIAKRVGYSAAEVKKYYDLNNLPQQVLDLIASGKLAVSKALLLLQLPDPRAQVQAAEDIVRYNYTEAQARELVRYYLEAYSEAPVTPRVPAIERPKSETQLRCEVCDTVFEETAMYHWICPDCWKAIKSAIEQAEQESAQAQAQAQGDVSPSG
jgi:ParB family chromosome partitioning protein